MPRRTALKPRKAPSQRRSRDLNEAILEAAIRVLEREGAQRFTTTRVAEVAGVSVGSLYQYYPNKASLLFCLHEREARRTWDELSAILADGARSPRRRLIAAVRRFFETEAEEAELRRALQVAETLFWELPEFRAVRERAQRDVEAFLRHAGVPARRVAFETRLVLALVSGVAERITRDPPAAAELRRCADACSEMLCARLEL